MSNKIRQWATLVKRDVCALYLASRDSRVPWHAKMVAWLVVAYALSPIDLIPDFIPVIGYLDDLVILPLGILLVIRLVPSNLMAEHRAAAENISGLPQSWIAAAVIVVLWVVGMTWLGWLLLDRVDFE